MKAAVALALCCALGCSKPNEPTPVSAPATPTAESYGTSTITGKVSFKGTPPKPVTIKMSADPYCSSAHSDSVSSQDLLVNDDGTLRNVFVYVKKGVAGKYPAPPTPVVIDQNGCLYRPRVQGMQVGQTLLIRNSDDTLHNIHALAEVNPAFNLGQPAKGMESKRTFAQPEVMLRFKCDVHPWMTCYIGILEHPFFGVTGDDGAFTLANLPAGEYVIEAWHEKFGVRQQTVTLGKDETKTLEFTFAANP